VWAVRADPPDPAPQHAGASHAPAPQHAGASHAPAPQQAGTARAAASQPARAARAPDPGTLPPGLANRLTAAGISDLSDPVAAWCRLREAEGPRATGIDLYWLAARGRGLAPGELPRAERAGLAAAVFPVLFPGFGAIAEADRGREPIEIVPWDPGWPARYARWRERITAALGATALRTEHVGSTSVPGLDAKPVIDIQVSVADIGDEARYAGRLAAAGLQLRSRDSLHRFFRPFPDRPRDAHLHVCQAGGAWERDHLLFRDYLRAHPAACQRYLAGKRAAAATWRDDRFAYTEAKTGVILDILGEAETWARRTGWALSPSS
jgi:GrpB-like predicted nucleotidyltransferase (UPF0157 family)